MHISFVPDFYENGACQQTLLLLSSSEEEAHFFGTKALVLPAEITVRRTNSRYQGAKKQNS